MKQAIQAVTGMKDLLPGDVEMVRALEDRARQLFGLYGYREIRTPLLEFTELFRKATGETTDIVEKEMYAFTDAGEKEIALRPEGTPSVVRALLEHGLNKQASLNKLWYVGPMFRRERPQEGRFRQFSQIGVEAFGQASSGLDVEVIEMLSRYLYAVGLRGLELRLNSIGCRECRPGYRASLKMYAQARAPRLCKNCQSRIERNPLRLLDCKVESCQAAMVGAPMITEALCEACRAHFGDVQDGLKALGVAFVLAPRLVRGLDYYTRTTFEFLDGKLGAQNSVVGGGRYDNLVESMGGDPLPAIGFAIGVERMVMGLMRRGAAPSTQGGVLVYLAAMGTAAVQRVLSLTSVLRYNGIASEMNFEEGKSLKAQMRQANQCGAGWVVIVGDQELRKQVVMLKNLTTGHQEEIPMEHLTEKIREAQK